MPYANNSFATVLSVSVLEHISNIDEVVTEVFRVLKPKGQFIFTTNTPKINSMLHWPKVCHAVGLHPLAGFYIKSFNRVFHHVTLLDKNQWKKILERSGFKIVTSREIISPCVTEFYDTMLITSWPSQVTKIVFGKRWAWKPKWFREWLVRKFSPVVESDDTEGSNLFIVAYKPK
jgi:ubiquinone/menaquinone biosynthesis C-methylase UbiE